MISVAEIFSNPLIPFSLGLIPSIITVLLYYQEKVSSKEKVLHLPLLKLYDITEKILEEKNSRDLFINYEKMGYAKADFEKIRQININKVLEEEQRKAYEEAFGKYIVSFLNFSGSFNNAEKLIQLCIDFDLEYQKIDTDGLLSLLKKRHKETFTKLVAFEQYAKGVIFITERIRKENLKTEVQPEGQEPFRDVQPTEQLRILFQMLSVTMDLIALAPEVEKQLSKFL
jgi:hypothetical protein